MSDRLRELDELIVAQEEVIREVLELVRTVKRGKSKTLRNGMAVAIRDHFDFWKYKCCKCGAWKKPGEFPIDRTRKSQGAYAPVKRRGECKICNAVKRNDKYWKDPEHCRAIKRKSTAKQKEEKKGKLNHQSKASTRTTGVVNGLCGKKVECGMTYSEGPGVPSV